MMSFKTFNNDIIGKREKKLHMKKQASEKIFSFPTHSSMHQNEVNVTGNHLDHHVYRHTKNKNQRITEGHKYIAQEVIYDNVINIKPSSYNCHHNSSQNNYYQTYNDDDDEDEDVLHENKNIILSYNGNYETPDFYQRNNSYNDPAWSNNNDDHFIDSKEYVGEDLSREGRDDLSDNNFVEISSNFRKTENHNVSSDNYQRNMDYYIPKNCVGDIQCRSQEDYTEPSSSQASCQSSFNYNGNYHYNKHKKVDYAYPEDYIPHSYGIVDRNLSQTDFIGPSSSQNMCLSLYNMNNINNNNSHESNNVDYIYSEEKLKNVFSKNKKQKRDSRMSSAYYAQLTPEQRKLRDQELMNKRSREYRKRQKMKGEIYNTYYRGEENKNKKLIKQLEKLEKELLYLNSAINELDKLAINNSENTLNV